MKNKKTVKDFWTIPKAKKESTFLFSKMNYIIMVVGLVFIVLGFILMIGGGSNDPNVFNEAIFNTQRLVVAPILLMLGYLLQFAAILYKPKSKEKN